MYQSVVFIHILAAFAMFSLWVSDVIVFLIARQTNGLSRPGQRFIAPLQMISMVTVLISGLYLMHDPWGPQPWLVTSVVLLLSVIVVHIGLTVAAKRSPKIQNRALLFFVLSMYKIATALAIVNLMVFKDSAYETSLAKVLVTYLIVFIPPVVVYKNKTEMRSDIH